MTQADAIRIDPRDNAAVALRPFARGYKALEVVLTNDIPAGHKFALSDIPAGSAVVKYGAPIGYARADIAAGSHIHTHNLKTGLEGALEYEYGPEPIVDTTGATGSFMGYRRSDGRAGVRNEIWIINTVGCVNKIAERLADEANRRFAGRTDGIFSFSHPFGCSQLGDDHENTRKILADMALHPNAAGALVLGLGCENNTIENFRPLLGNFDPNRIRFLKAQDCEDEHAEGLGLIGELVSYAEGFKREPCPLGDLIIGLKCGGSDGFSGITGNPLVGRVSDRLIGLGGSAILTEVPEMFGAETLLMNRCASSELFEDTVEMINGFKTYFARHGQVVYENPSPGNKEGGITTLEEKSLGCVQKGGGSPVRGVLPYGGRVSERGLNLLNGPGNDIVAITALAAAGAQIILFTTGRGTPVGAPVPTLKIATNSELARRKPHWIDYDAGALLAGKGMDEAAGELFELVLSVAAGDTRAKNELSDYREISIFKDGVTL